MNSVALPIGVDAQPSLARPFAGLGPNKAPHHKDVPVPHAYNGSVQGWLGWSTALRRFLAARDTRWAPLLDAIDGLRGNLVTAQDEASWEW